MFNMYTTQFVLRALHGMVLGPTCTCRIPLSLTDCIILNCQTSLETLNHKSKQIQKQDLYLNIQIHPIYIITYTYYEKIDTIYMRIKHNESLKFTKPTCRVTFRQRKAKVFFEGNSCLHHLSVFSGSVLVLFLQNLKQIFFHQSRN